MNNKPTLTLCIFRWGFASWLSLSLPPLSPNRRLILNLIRIAREKKGTLDEVQASASVTARGKPRHGAEGDASRSSSQAEAAVGAQVNTLKSSSRDRWGVSHTPSLPPYPFPPPFPLINSQSEETDVTQSRQHLKISPDFLLLSE